jgi:hypothetical protein
MSLMIAVAAAAAAQPICTDRPAKANAVCTVTAGRVQIESSLGGWSLSQAHGVRTESLSLGSSVVKLGLTNTSDLQLAITPYARLATKQAGSRASVSGFGDMLVRYKQRLTDDGAKVQVAAIPFIKLPTATHGLGNDQFEGGLALPVSFPLSGPATMTLGPEVDLLADGDGHGRHPAVVNLVNISGPIGPKLTLAGELWTNFNFDPTGTIKQASADLALAYAFSQDLQVDAGGNLGLTRATPDVELYAGASIRF